MLKLSKRFSNSADIEKSPGWLVDVHDGNNIPFKDDEIIAPHLIHRDLMILDFILTIQVKAIKILRKLAGDKHFNMLIVYTNDDIEAVVRDIALGLAS